MMVILKPGSDSNLFIGAVVEDPVLQGWDVWLLRRVREVCVEPGRSGNKETSSQWKFYIKLKINY